MLDANTIGLVLPARNEERLLGRTLDAVPNYVDLVYVVDDASHDGTAGLVKARAEEEERIRLLRHETNLGPGGAIITGYREAATDGCDIVVVAGADFQMPFDQMEDLIAPILAGTADYAKGNRFLESGEDLDDMPRLRLVGNTFLSLATKLASGYFKIFDVVDGYTATTKHVIESIDWNRVWPGYGYPMDFLVHLNVYGFRVVDVPRRAIYLVGERQSQIKSLPYVGRVLPMLFRRFFWRLKEKYVFRDFHPLVFLYFLSFLSIPLGLLVAAYLVLTKLHGGGPSGATAVMCALFLSIGIQSLFFAMLFDMFESR